VKGYGEITLRFRRGPLAVEGRDDTAVRQSNHGASPRQGAPTSHLVETVDLIITLKTGPKLKINDESNPSR
jgi:hypothetical protein